MSGDADQADVHQLRLQKSHEEEQEAGERRDDGGDPVDRARPLSLGQVLQIENAVGGKGRVEAEDGDHRKKEDGQREGEYQSGDRDAGHCPEVDLAPAAMGLAAFGSRKCNRRTQERHNTAGNVQCE